MLESYNLRNDGCTLSSDETAQLLTAYKNEGLQRFHDMNAAIKPLTTTSEEFWSYTTLVAKYLLVFNGETHLHVFWMDDNATYLSKTTTRQLIRWINEKTHAQLSVNDVRWLQDRKRRVVSRDFPCTDVHTGCIHHHSILFMVAGSLCETDTYGYVWLSKFGWR